ncbi:MAG: hypothetical protein ABI460_07900 [Caldimonas sp.]
MRVGPSLASSAATVLLLAACGGGGGDSAAPVAASYAVAASFAHLLAAGGSWTMSGTANGQSFTLVNAFAPAAAGTFPLTGVAASELTETLTVTVGNQITVASETIYFDRTSGAIFGAQSDGSCSGANSNTPLPTTAALGASGPIYASSDYVDCTTSSGVVGTTANTWSLVADSGVVLLCWNLTSKDPSGTVNGSESSCFEIAADGTPGGKATFSASALGATLQARNF